MKMKCFKSLTTTEYETRDTKTPCRMYWEKGHSQRGLLTNCHNTYMYVRDFYYDTALLWLYFSVAAACRINFACFMCCGQLLQIYL